MNPVLLLVDDDEAIRIQMKWALSADYEIISAEDRAGAVENFKKKKPRSEEHTSELQSLRHLVCRLLLEKKKKKKKKKNEKNKKKKKKHTTTSSKYKE